MDDVIVRPRYPRHNIHARKKKRSERDTNTISVNIVRQVLISALILAAVWGLKSINSPLTNFVCDKIRWTVVQNMDIRTVYESIDSLINRAKPENAGTGKEDGTDGDASYDKYLPVNGSINYEGTVNGTVQVNEELQPAAESSSEDAVDSVGSIISPVEGILSSPYGERVDPFTKEIKFHKGIDIEAAKGSPIKAAADGEVVEAAVLRTYGKYVKIKHSSGVETVYAHCSEYLVKKGQKVNQGDTIAKVGDTGLSTGVHIHFELWKDGNSLNPQDFLDVPI